MADAMTYEYLLRRVYQVGRYGRKGADADEYRRLERTASLYRTESHNIANKLSRTWLKPIEELEHDYNVSCRKIWGYVSKAINDGLKRYGHQFSEEERQSLENCTIEPELLTKSAIDTVIDKASDIFVAHKIYPA